MIKRFTKLLTTCFLAIVLLTTMTLFFVGCGSGEPEKSSEPTILPVINSSALGYLEDFGNEVVTNSRLKEGYETLQDKDSSYEGYEEAIPRKIFFSHLTAPAGNYSATLGDIVIGDISITEEGDAMLTALPEGLALGEKYTLTCTMDNGNNTFQPYVQTVRLVSRAIDNGEELIRALTYYTRFLEMKTGIFDGEDIFNSPAPADTTNAGKYYNGQTFSRRLYVLATSIDISHNQTTFGVDGYGTSGTDAFRNPYANLWRQRYVYCYDEFDGQGNTIVVNTFVDGSLFGHLGQTAYIHDLYFNPVSTWWNAHAPQTKTILAMSISSGARVENVAMYIGFQVTLGGMNALATVVKEGAILKDIYIGLSSSVVFDFSTYGRELSGYLGSTFEPEVVDNIVVISPYLSNASWTNIDDELHEVGAQNDYDEYYIDGVYHFDYVDEALNNGKSIVGSWYIRTDGSVKWKNS